MSKLKVGGVLVLYLFLALTLVLFVFFIVAFLLFLRIELIGLACLVQCRALIHVVLCNYMSLH